jgi:outer membrane protein TolC
VAQSNVALTTREVEQANDRFVAGVDTNLALVQAQAALAGAQSQLINDTLQYNQAKLGLARNLGIVDTQYRTYLHGR